LPVFGTTSLTHHCPSKASSHQTGCKVCIKVLTSEALLHRHRPVGKPAEIQLQTLFGRSARGPVLSDSFQDSASGAWLKWTYVGRSLRARPSRSTRIADYGNESSYPAPRDQRVVHLRKMRILLADDHRTLLELVRNLLEPTFEIVGRVEDGESLVEAAGQLQPDVIITDIAMPKLNGIEAAYRLKESGSSSKIVFLTAHGDPDFVQAALDTGALAFVNKVRMNSDLLIAIGEALEGRIFVSA
jgi:CheY-like chemotaxis protein